MPIRFARAFAVALALLAVAVSANAQEVVRVDDRRPVYEVPVVVRPTPQSEVAVAPAPAVAAAPVAYGDPYGFTVWLNTIRASRGLALVVYDPGLASWAASNNATQAARGLGHFVRHGRRQNAGWGSYAAVCASWLRSPAHAAALYDPGVRRVGIAGNGPWWTVNLD